MPLRAIPPTASVAAFTTSLPIYPQPLSTNASIARPSLCMAANGQRTPRNSPIEWVSAVTTGTVLGLGVASIVTMSGLSTDMMLPSAWGYTQPATPTSADATLALPPAIKEDYLPAERGVISLFERATQSVAYVTTYMEALPGFSLNPMEMPAGAGSGIVWDKEGRIVTNFHVIRDASAAKITLANKCTYDAELVGSSADDDVAVLKIKAPREELFPIDLGTSSDLRVGQNTYAIGNPFGLDHTLTTGVLSGLRREMKSPTGRTISNVIQTEASINPGNSGGPLIDARGRLIGMNTAIYSPSGASAGVGFAIPVDTLKVIATGLIQNGRIVRPIIGISFLDTSQARALGVQKGVLILDVPVGSAAQKAGLHGTSRQTFRSFELGDIIIGLDNVEISNESDLFKALDTHNVGDNVSVRVIRADNELVLKLKLTASQK